MDTKRVNHLITSLFVKHGDVKLLDDAVAGGVPGRGGGVLVEGGGHGRHGALLLTPASGGVVGGVPGAGVAVVGVREVSVHGAIHGPVEHVAECRFSEIEFSHLRKKDFLILLTSVPFC